MDRQSSRAAGKVRGVMGSKMPEPAPKHIGPPVIPPPPPGNKHAHDVRQLLLLLASAKHLLMAATGPEGGPTNWNETRERWMDAMEFERRRHAPN